MSAELWWAPVLHDCAKPARTRLEDGRLRSAVTRTPARSSPADGCGEPVTARHVNG